MKPGSIVECIDNSLFTRVLQLNTPYTVFEVAEKGTRKQVAATVGFYFTETCIYLEEVRDMQTIEGCRVEVPFPARFFRELDFNVEELVTEVFNREPQLYNFSIRFVLNLKNLQLCVKKQLMKKL